MARREVTVDDVPQGNFKKVKDLFQEKGDQFVGLFVSSEINTRLDKNPLDCTFKERDGKVVTITVSGLLQKLIEKAAPIAGEKVTITFTGTKPTNSGNDMRLFKVNVDEAKPTAKPAPKQELFD